MTKQATLFEHHPKVQKKRPSLPENPRPEEDYSSVSIGRFPKWLHRKLPKGKELWSTDKLLKNKGLHTVCEEAKCPNRLECYSKKTATFLILGKSCTRACGFCDIDFSKAPPLPDINEPKQVSLAVKELSLEHVVITMVARDDLEDGGASHLVSVLNQVKKDHPHVTIEVLTSDFSGNLQALKTVLQAQPDIFNHNLETVASRSPKVRHKATYTRSLSMLSYAKENSAPGTFIKSGIMLGLGEEPEEIQQALKDLKEAGCDIVTLGQYLQPNRHKLRVQAFITPETFKEYEIFGHSLGISHVYSGPFVRSSYNASSVLKNLQEKLHSS